MKVCVCVYAYVCQYSLFLDKIQRQTHPGKHTGIRGESHKHQPAYHINIIQIFYYNNITVMTYMCLRAAFICMCVNAFTLMEMNE